MIDIEHVFTCDADGCEHSVGVGRRYHNNEVLAVPHAPDGWTRIGGNVYCPSHKVILEIDRTAHGGQQIDLHGINL